jgi:2-succinyl-5-enolpyruvyl-6-hydroxy-3-cyclohexene-1-carboxylate synthase
VDTGNLNLRWAYALVDGLAAAGVSHAVISPGSRSTPLALACDRHPSLATWVLPDERCAAFYALGLARGGQGPTAVIATSGSAPAHWYPAIIEASQDQQSLVLISADRPAELHDCGANQTVDQTRLFGVHVRQFFQLPEPDKDAGVLRQASLRAQRLVDISRWPLPGPVHLNVPLREPLVPEDDLGDLPTPSAPGVQIAHPQLSPDPGELQDLACELSGRPGLILCGRLPTAAGLAPAIGRLARRLDCPVLADPLSGLRFGPHDRSLILARYDSFLRRTAFTRTHRPSWVLGLGGVPTSKALQTYLDGLGPLPRVTVVPFGPWSDPGHRCTRVIHTDPESLCRALSEFRLAPAPASWSEAFLAEERRCERRLDEMRRQPLEAEILGLLARHAPAGATLFLGSSMVIRDADSFLAGSDRPLTLIGNRGVSGIDGHVSTLMGLAAARREPVIGVLGDLALYHDMNGLLAARGLGATLIVFNNRGGAIFDYLPQARLPDYERYWRTPTGLDPAKIADLYGLRHWRVSDARAFQDALLRALQDGQEDLIEVVLDPQLSLARHRAYWEAITG